MIKRIFWAVIITAILGLSVISTTVFSAASGDVLKFTATASDVNKPLKYFYWTIAKEEYVFKAGDTLEYDVYNVNKTEGLGGFEVYSTEEMGLRDWPTFKDQNGIAGHPSYDLSLYANKKWYHRVLAIPSGAYGSTVMDWCIPIEISFAKSTTFVAYYDNIVITNKGKVVKTIYSDGQPSANETRMGTNMDYTIKVEAIPFAGVNDVITPLTPGPVITPTPAPQQTGEKTLTLVVNSTNLKIVTGNRTETVKLDTSPVIKAERTFLPIRPVVEALGGALTWNAEEQRVDITQGTKTISLWINRAAAKVNGVEVQIDANASVVPFISEAGRTMLPLRFVADNLGAQLTWVAETQTIILKSNITSGSVQTPTPGQTPTPEPTALLTPTPKPTPAQITGQGVTGTFGPKLTVGAYYYPWYSAKSWPGKYLRGYLSPSQLPYLGQYDNNSIDVSKQHIKWAKDYGVDYFLMSWWGQDSGTDETLRNSFLKADNIADIKFGILYETTSRLGKPVLDKIAITPASEAVFKSDMAYLARTYFNHPSYLKSEGKPVIFVYLSRCFTGDYESMIKNTREYIKKSFGIDLFIIGDQIYWGGILTSESLSPYDATTLYNPHGPSIAGDYPAANKLEEKVENLYNYSMEENLNNNIHFIPNAIPGFNDRGVRLKDNHSAIPREMNKGEEGKETTLSTFLDISYKYKDPILNTILITSWNEWFEDSQIEPTIIDAPITNTPNTYTQGYSYAAYGFKDLEIIRDFKQNHK